MYKLTHPGTTMHLIFLVLLLSLAAPATAQSTQPSNLQEAPPPPELPELPELSLESSNAADPLLEEPQVIIRKSGEDRIEEYHMHGDIYMIKVTPRIGFPYYLIDDTGDGAFYRGDGTLEDGIRPPMWVIYQF